MLEPYNSFRRLGDIVAPPDIRQKAKYRSTQSKRRAIQRRAGKKGARKK